VTIYDVLKACKWAELLNLTSVICLNKSKVLNKNITKLINVNVIMQMATHSTCALY